MADFRVGVGVGCTPGELETPEVVRHRILYTVRATRDSARVYVNPDCGLRTRTWALSRTKMEIMAKGTDLARKELKAKAR